MSYPASLRQQAKWIREALDPATEESRRITLDDIDADELEAAASEIERLEEALRWARSDLIIAVAEIDRELNHKIAGDLPTAEDVRGILGRR